MNLLVMGAGYVGMALLKSLQKLPYHLFITTTEKSRIETLQSYGAVIFLDPSNDHSLQEAISKCDAAVILVAPKKASSYQATYQATAEKIIASLHGRKDPFYLLYTSSTGVYEGIEGWVDEKTSVNPTSENNKTLLEAEKIYQEGWVDTCILRLGGIYGPGRELKDRSLRLANKEMPADVFTNHIHQEDIVNAILFCLEKRLKGLYLLVNDSHPTRKELYSRFPNQIIWTPPTFSGYKVSNEKIRLAGFMWQHPQV